MDIHTDVIAPCIILLLIGLVSHAGAVPITLEYYYLEGCSDCDHVKPLITEIERDLGESVSLAYLDVRTPEGLARFRHHGFTEVPAVVVNGAVRIPKEEITEENIRAAIEQSLSGTEPEAGLLAINWDIPFAYSLGLFSGFSPCLMAILGFILVYVTGSGKGLRSSLLNSLIFGLGLVAAYIVMGCCFLLAGMSLGGFGPYLAVAAGLITILAGVNLLGLIRLPVSADSYIRSAIRRHSTTLAGLFILGMIFSIVKAPCAAPMLLVLLSRILIDGTVQDLSLLLVFGAGVLTPFLGVGVLGGYASSSRIRGYRDLIKAASGVILIGFGLWLIFWG
ncbi:cytochrome c biogenesis CcdA family protein [Methanoculleus sp.]|jgi:cytochrome c biogenesis protein CcdA|uniref:cytochrome c biogenesis CcdA family protein n=1 Tax=Methanoculleus sp. TaxID=90427 RepID=UPI001BD5CBCD|nr:cytochrome c biogenesis CcdA family protein [Methanoculleus sp.]